MDFLDDVKEQIIGAASDYVQGGNVRISVKTNFGPELPLYSGSDGNQGGGIADLVGFKAQVIVRDKSGKVITTYGEPEGRQRLLH